jgi:hypothetical protein
MTIHQKENTRIIVNRENLIRSGRRDDIGQSSKGIWGIAKYVLIITGSFGQLIFKGGNTFVTGCSNKKISTITDHEKCNMHLTAVSVANTNKQTDQQVLLNSDGKVLNSLQLSERNRHTHLHVFRNVHVIIEHHKTFCDYVYVSLMWKGELM